MVVKGYLMADDASRVMTKFAINVSRAISEWEIYRVWKRARRSSL